MKTQYVSKAERENIILMDAFLGTLTKEIVPRFTAKFGGDISKRLKVGTTNLVKALQGIYGGLDQHDKEKLGHESRTKRIILSSHAYQPKDQTPDKQTDIMATLAEFAIGNTCRGCTKDGNTCALRHALALADIPYSTDEPENCPYELPGEDGAGNGRSGGH